MKPGRNDPCPCGSGRKYKHCCQAKESGGAGQSNAGQLTQAALAQMIQKSVAHHNAGRLSEAEDGYRKVLQAMPNHPEALHRLGLIAHQTGHHTEALQLIRKAIALNDQVADYHFSLGNILQTSGNFDAAAKSFEAVLRINPDLAEAHNNLGSILREKGDYRKAEACFQRALAFYPDNPFIHANLAATYFRLARYEDAAKCARRAIESNPDFDAAYVNLGAALNELSRVDEAAACYRQAISLNPQSADARNNLGSILASQGEYEAAIELLRQVLRDHPKHAGAHCNLGHALQRQGRLAEALASFKAALTINPDFGGAWQNYLFCLNYASGYSAQAIFEEHVKFGRRLEEAVAGLKRAHGNERDPGKRLKIGYVSPDFRAHAVAYFIEPALERHAREGFEIYCYFNSVAADVVTQRLKAKVRHWREIAAQPDGEVAELIRRDGIDILVDLAGHTAGNRLGVFARKPAPVQATWLGYVCTTGLGSIDYRITDVNADPVGLSERYYTEELVRLPDTFVCYRPGDHSPAVDALPGLKNGYVTFASFNNLAKMTPEVRKLWALVLLAAPGSRLMLKTKGLSDVRMRQQLVEDFARHDVPEHRLELIAWDDSYSQHLNRYNEVDIGLDPFPCNGGTTSFDAMWMGVPVVTLAGDSFISRMGVSMLTSLGLTELIAQTPEDYVAIAARMAGDLGRLAALRAGLRERMANSPLTDAKGFTLGLEKAYREMWTTWCGGSRREAR